MRTWLHLEYGTLRRLPLRRAATSVENTCISARSRMSSLSMAGFDSPQTTYVAATISRDERVRVASNARTGLRDSSGRTKLSRDIGALLFK